MIQLILGILLCSIALTAKQIRNEAVIYSANKNYTKFTTSDIIISFIINLVLITSIFYIGDLLLNLQVTLT